MEYRKAVVPLARWGLISENCGQEAYILASLKRTKYLIHW